MREKYNEEKEHQVIGWYPSTPAVDMGTGKIPAQPNVYRPVSRGENLRMFFEGKTPYWMPNTGWTGCDMQQFRPRQHPDNIANRQCFDGGPDVDFSKRPIVSNGWLNIPLKWSSVVSGATAEPGFSLLDDMNDWKKVVQLPDLDDLDWDEIREMNRGYLATDKFNQLGIQYSFWERMMNLMDVSNAAMALLDEDQEEAIHEFLDALADLYIDFIDRMTKIGRIDCVMLHDDWGTQKSTFFSLETARKFFVPPLKRVTDFIHSKGMVYEHHSCGKAETLIPAFIEAGVDFWTPQPFLNDLDAMIEKYKDEPIAFCVSTPVLPKGSSDDDIRKMAEEWTEKYLDKHVCFTMCVAAMDDPNHDQSKYALFADTVYKTSRIAYQNAE